MERQVLCPRISDPSNRGTGRGEPILLVVRYGKGRVFHTILGHDIAALSCVGFIATFQRGTEWATTGKVTQKLPADFPTADRTSTRAEFTPPPGWVSPAAPPGRASSKAPSPGKTSP